MKFFSIILLATSSALLFSCAPEPNEEKVYPKATHLFFANYPGKEVGVMDINIVDSYTTVADNNDGLDTVSGIAVDFIGGKIYAVEELKNRIVRFNVDGSGGLEVLYDEGDSVRTPTCIALDVPSRTIYWANSGTGQIKKASMDGGTASSIYLGKDSVITYCYGLAVDSKNKFLFFSDLLYAESGSTTSIRYARTDGAKLDGFNRIGYLFSRGTTSGTVLRNPSAIFLDEDNRYLYWADEGLNTISIGSFAQLSSNLLSPGSAAALFDDFDDGVSRPNGISIDRGAKKIYWTETSDTGKKIVRGNLDGTGETEAILEDVESYSIVLKFEGDDKDN